MNGVTFGEKHSYRDWGLITAARTTVSPPKVKKILIDIPGTDGSIDVTESLTGDVKYYDRNMEFTFTVIDERRRWSSVYSEIMDYLHGRRMKVVLDEDPNYYYMGRFEVNEWQSDKTTATLIISGTVEPYKLEIHSSLEDWLWDTFNFENGIIREYGNMEVDGELTINIPGTRKAVTPSFEVASMNGKGMDVIYAGTTYHLPDGKSKVINIMITTRETQITVVGNGTISIDYRGGQL